MDATVVQEIATQLGMAVDATSEWLTATLPFYAGYRVAVAVAWIIISAVVIAAASLMAVYLYRRTSGIIEQENQGCYISLGWYDHLAALAMIIVLAILAALFFVPLLVNIDVLVRWAFFPEGATLDMVLKAVQR